jgi:hypothetical protein
VSGLGYGGIRRACRRPVKTFDQVLTVREIEGKSRGDKGGKTKDCQLRVHTDSSS